ncbi:hypothetical protein MUO14_12715 [Halobacillus shinanisalinarum]|uniref:Uncharacterized protein n=1 Tax=Halobacillus shinanisalinarum TaxID=2932258 RepID=A0ABY4GTH7_9BACI|nr:MULTISPECIES: CBO0543 family protein [Bacillaceae]UOQ91448.1 hypothetical protein MUO14_12715 [Halobacillus shinanisalinarum]
MTMEQIILVLAWVISISILLIFIPKDKIRNAIVAFQFKQVLTWLFGLAVVQMRMIEYPVRLFDYASRASFTFEFLAYPAICAIFNVHYPEGKSKIAQFGYYALYTSVITVTEVILERYTNLIVYIHWSWYWTWITLFTTFFLSHLFYKWFFRKINTGHTK